MPTRNNDRYAVNSMAMTMFTERAARDKDAAPEQASYLKGVHDAIEFMQGMAGSGASPATVRRLLCEMHSQTSNAVIAAAH